ncbi:MAG TPA: carboxypeptidase regulatory-like domain-containing protein [Thermoanaerobaculia bacterium]|nr:carboxypeptidase regulatory-like domain-containing protein [Thermoanaerobaculia bacterium]
MRLLLTVAACLLLAHAARGESYTVRVEETAIIEIAGATAAFTTNPAIADVATPATGRLSVTGHSSGTTQLVVITAGGTQAYLITVAAPVLPSAVRQEAGAPLARYEGRYSSGSERVQNTFDLVTHDGDRSSEIHVLHFHDLRTEPGLPSDAIGSIFYQDTTPSRQLTLLDDTVDLSRMTISNTQVRGLHLKDGPLELHAGYASSTIFDDFFLPAQRRWVGGGGYGIDLASTRLTPSVYGFFSQPTDTAARRGVVGALTAEHRDGDTLYLRGDVGVSRSLAASGEVRYLSSQDQFRALLSMKPDDFPNLGLADISGSHGELDWTRRATDRLSITSYGTYDRLNLAALRQTIGAASLGLGYAVTARLSFLGGADASTVRTPTTSIRTIGLPLGVAYDTSAFGLAASYRLLDNSEASRRGDTLRLSAHAGGGPFTASVWAERQRQAPTLDLIFREEPGLELALLRLGISVRTPEDVARALRDNAALIDLGLITGVNVALTPRRLQAGFNLAWLGSGPRSDHLRLLAVYDHDDGISTTRDNLIATLTYSRRVLTATDLYASYSWWRTSVSALQQAGTSVEIGVQQQFSGLPRFLQRSGTIEGFAFLDPEMRGVRDQSTKPLQDIAVTLDGTRTARTDGKGAYAFDKVPPGPHRIVAQLPGSPRAFFTTNSRAETTVPAHIDFGLVWAAARIDGRVISDAGVAIPGAVLTAATQNGHLISATSDAQGLFVFAVPPGTFRVGLTAESLPAGYSIAEPREKSVTVEAGQPQSVTFAVRVRRSIAGRAKGASEVHIESLAITAPVDAEGNFLFRSLPSGTFTIVARIGGRTVSNTVTLPSEPTIMRDVVLGAASPSVANVPSPSAAPAPGRKETSQPAERAPYVVQAGAFREERNAAQLIGRLRRSQNQPFSVASHGLTHVYIGPFETRQKAAAASERLRRAGFDGFVTRR